MTTTIDWESTLPQELTTDGYSQSAADNLLRTSMDTGPAKVRRRATSAPRPVGGTVIMDETQLATFKTFYATTILGGSLRFNWVDPDDGSTAVEMRFTSPPSWTVLGGDLYRVTLALEILP